MGGQYGVGVPVVTCVPSTYGQAGVIRHSPSTTMTTPSAGSSGLRSASIHNMDTNEVILSSLMTSSDDLQTPVHTPQGMTFSDSPGSLFASPRTMLGLEGSQTEAERRAGQEVILGAPDDDGATGDDARRVRDDGTDDNV